MFAQKIADQNGEGGIAIVADKARTFDRAGASFCCSQDHTCQWLAQALSPG